MNAALLKQHDSAVPPFLDGSFASERAALPLFWQGKHATKALSLFVETIPAFRAALNHDAALLDTLVLGNFQARTCTCCINKVPISELSKNNQLEKKYT